VYQKSRRLRLAPVCVVAFSSILAACSQSVEALDSVKTASVSSTRGYSMKDRECLARAMFFESIRSSREGLVAVGTVVMNRVDSPKYPDSVCAVVGQKNQFAPGVLSRKMNSKALPDVMAAADAVLKGERHTAVKNAHFFHQAGLKFPYKNMHYVLEAGGNAFYEKRSRRSTQVAEAEKPAETVVTDTTMMSYSVEPQAADAIGAMLAGQTRPLAAE
jgi:spore germination cell wall hydrolase CwlJ-like protein